MIFLHHRKNPKARESVLLFGQIFTGIAYPLSTCPDHERKISRDDDDNDYGVVYLRIYLSNRDKLQEWSARSTEKAKK